MQGILIGFCLNYILLKYNFINTRVVNVSSLLGVLKMIKNEEIRKKLLDPSLTIETVSTIIQQYIQFVKIS